MPMPKHPPYGSRAVHLHIRRDCCGIIIRFKIAMFILILAVLHNDMFHMNVSSVLMDDGSDYSVLTAQICFFGTEQLRFSIIRKTSNYSTHLLIIRRGFRASMIYSFLQNACRCAFVLCSTLEQDVFEIFPI